MIISLDYDETFTRDPNTWLSVIKVLQSAGHTVICCTLRYDIGLEATEVRNALNYALPIYFTNREGKKDFMHKQGINVDVWIDDNPTFILHTAAA